MEEIMQMLNDHRIVNGFVHVIQVGLLLLIYWRRK